MITIPTVGDLIRQRARWVGYMLFELPVMVTRWISNAFTLLHLRLQIFQLMVGACNCQSCDAKLRFLRFTLALQKSTLNIQEKQ